MSGVNLLPPEILQGHRYRRLTALVAAGCALLLFLVFAFYVVQTQRLAGVNGDIADQEARNQNIQTQIGALQGFATLQETAQAKQQLLSAAYAGEVSFSRLLMDISRVIPTNMALDSLALQLTAQTAGTTTPTTTGPTVFVGTLTVSGRAVSVQEIADWLNRLEQVEGWVNPWTASATLDEGGASYTFNSSVDLTNGVITDRGGGSGEG